MTVNERLRRAVIIDILPGLSLSHQECPPKRGKPKITWNGTTGDGKVTTRTSF
jgi:hypothetical protein